MYVVQSGWILDRGWGPISANVITIQFLMRNEGNIPEIDRIAGSGAGVVGKVNAVVINKMKGTERASFMFEWDFFVTDEGGPTACIPFQVGSTCANEVAVARFSDKRNLSNGGVRKTWCGLNELHN